MRSAAAALSASHLLVSRQEAWLLQVCAQRTYTDVPTLHSTAASICMAQVHLRTALLTRMLTISTCPVSSSAKLALSCAQSACMAGTDCDYCACSVTTICILILVSSDC